MAVYRATMHKPLVVFLTLLAASLCHASPSPSVEHVTDAARFAYVSVDDDGLRLSANTTSLVYGVLGALAVAVILLLLTPLLEAFGVQLPFAAADATGAGYSSAYSSHPAASSPGYHDAYTTYQRSLDSAMPVLKYLQEVWKKYE